MNNIAPTFQSLSDDQVVIPLVQCDMLPSPSRGPGAANRRAAQHRDNHLGVVSVRSREGLPQRNSLPIDVVVPLGADLGPVGGVLPSQIPPLTGAWTVTLSTACHSQSIPLRWSYSFRQTPHNFRKTPRFLHFWKYRWHVLPTHTPGASSSTGNPCAAHIRCH
jgi:hypothetical protein